MALAISLDTTKQVVFTTYGPYIPIPSKRLETGENLLFHIIIQCSSFNNTPYTSIAV